MLIFVLSPLPQSVGCCTTRFLGPGCGNQMLGVLDSIFLCFVLMNMVKFKYLLFYFFVF